MKVKVKVGERRVTMKMVNLVTASIVVLENIKTLSCCQIFKPIVMKLHSTKSSQQNWHASIITKRRAAYKYTFGRSSSLSLALSRSIGVEMDCFTLGHIAGGTSSWMNEWDHIFCWLAAPSLKKIKNKSVLCIINRLHNHKGGVQFGKQGAVVASSNETSPHGIL